ncbi:chorismate mutase [Geosporobacter ferrireducens]|uniref:chorismate mutase n=1 Tax=Geosporobacter ferrireducens TaxID=1424294 RepID=UPI000A96BDA9|nr:chorismate mutase [Geosporobacter ferrireducens]
MKTIQEIRKEIDHCDEILIQAFEKRMELVLQVLEYKTKEGMPILDSSREEEIIAHGLRSVKNRDFSKEIEDFIKSILNISRKMQSIRLFPYNIILIGFMGTGKSAIGDRLSQLLRMECIDTDVLIERQMKTSIAKMFEEHGEKYFREAEKDMVKRVSYRKNTIISCGGGVVLHPDNVKQLKDNGKIVLLSAHPEIIYERVKEDQNLPVLKGNMSIEFIQKKMEERKDKYESAADIIVDTSNKDKEEICQEIVYKLLKNGK